jgi:hypothetical protein
MALAAWGLIWIAPVRADDTADMHAEISKLKTELESLSRQDAAELDSAIETYLAENDSWKGAQGEDRWKDITIGAAITAVNQNTLALDPGNKSVVNGRVDFWFNFKVAEGLELHVEMLGATGGAFPAEFPLDQGGFGPPATLAGAFDGIGVNSTVSTRPLGGVQVREAFIRYAYAAGNTTLNWELGQVDPRNRFLQNAFMNNQYSGFIHNQFKDASAISWATNGLASAGVGGDVASPTILSIYGWVSFGENDAFTVSYGWFNAPGEFFDHGQLYVQFGWKGQVRGREMNVQVLWVYDNAYNQAFNNGQDGDNQWGASWDWMASDKLGLFFRIAGNSEDTNFVEASAAFGMVYKDIGARKDELGLAIGYVKANTNSAIGFLPEDTEWSLEFYYKFMLADGKFQITPNLIYVADPGGGGLAWEDDTLFILGVRFYVPF